MTRLPQIRLPQTRDPLPQAYVRYPQACLRCNWKWLARVSIPRVCPRCKSYRWNQPARTPRPACKLLA